MEIKINKEGLLMIKRRGTFVRQCCPRDPDGAKCGDWCPLFGEPETRAYARAINDHISLSICGAHFDVLKKTFIDERV